MAKRGPKPTPTKVLELRGSWRAKTRPAEPRPASAKPPAPDWLDAAGKKLWRQLSARLVQLGLLTRIDQIALARYVTLFQRWRKYEDFIAQYGETFPIKNEAGQVVAFGEFRQARLATVLSDRLLRLEHEFGMTPAARAALGIQRATQEDTHGHEDEGKARFFKRA